MSVYASVRVSADTAESFPRRLSEQRCSGASKAAAFVFTEPIRER